MPAAARPRPYCPVALTSPCHLRIPLPHGPHLLRTIRMVTRPRLNENRGTDIVTAVDIVNQILQKIALIGARFWPVW